MLEVGWFSSFRDPEAVDLLEVAMEETRSGRINVHIPWVFANDFLIQTAGKVMEIVGKDSTPLFWINSKHFRHELWQNRTTRDEWRRLYDKRVLDFLQQSQKVDIIVLAGYMLIVSPVLCGHYYMLNLHPSLPGVHKVDWKKVTRKVVAEQDIETGSSMLWVREGVDDGPVASFCRVNVEGCDFVRVRELQFAQEIALVLATLDRIAKGIIGIGTAPADLTSVVEASMMA